MFDGGQIEFWHNNWLANQSLKDAFPEIYSLEADLMSVADARAWEDGLWKWNFHKFTINNILMFRWRLILNKLPTRDLLARRGIMGEVSESLCVMCNEELESKNHIFSCCQFSNNIWRDISIWLGDKVLLTIQELSSFFSHYKQVKDKKDRNLIYVIWLAMSWNIGLMCNTIIFKGIALNFDKYLSAIKFLSLKWISVGCNSSSMCSFYD